MVRGGFLRDSVLVISIDEQLCTDAAAETLGVLANLQVLQETIVDELGLNWREERVGVRLRV